MKKLYSKIVIVFLALFAVTMVSCLDDTEIDYGKGPIVVRFMKSELSQNFLKDGTGAVYDCEIPIEYKGGNGRPLNKPVSVTLALNADKSTAVEGKEFEMTATEFTIPEGETSVNAVIKVKAEQLDAEDPKTVVLDIVSSSETVSDKNSVTVVLQAICPSALAGNYVYTTGRKRDVVLTETGAGTYTVSCDDAFRGEYSFNITDVCGKLTVTGGFLQDNYNIPVSGTGTVDEATGEITIIYTVKGYFSNREMKMVKKK